MSLPISLLEFSQQLANFPFLLDEQRVAVAVSGGSDSLALLVLLKAWAEAKAKSLVALIVDHRLRLQSSQEALQVLEWVEQLGIQGKILIWEGRKPLGGIQAKAREKRYELLATYCWKHGIRSLFLAHHQDDQLETFLLRQEKQSQPYGLACMSAVSQRLGIRLVRPLLSFPKGRLLATLKKEGIPWVEDPSNQEMRFSRVRMRHHLATFSAEQKQELLSEIQAFAINRHALENQVAACVQQGLQVFPQGYASLQLDVFKNFSPEVQSLVLKKILQACGGQKHFFKQQQMDLWIDKILGGGLKQVRTLGGCCLVEREGLMWFYRELALVQSPCLLSPEEDGTISYIWDRRFYVELKTTTPLQLSYLGGAGVRALESEKLSCLEKRALASMPSLRLEGWGEEIGIFPDVFPDDLLFQAGGIKKRREPSIDRVVQKVVFLGKFVFFPDVSLCLGENLFPT
ncbi:MAG: tRNA lysidine(34) synthetase TilS [Alphaproteobacteria bacterium]